MSVKKEASGRRSVRVEVEVPGTPEQVWQAIASGPGISAWFVPSKVEGRVGGAVELDFGGGMVSSASITEWQPPHRFVAEDRSCLPGGPPMATEWSVEAKSGSTCIVRVVHSLFASTDDWDGQLESVEHGWPGYFRVLRHYLENHAGTPSTAFSLLAPAAEDVDAIWARLSAAFGAPNPKVGQSVRADAGGGVSFAGTVHAVDRVPQGHGAMLVLQLPVPGVVLASGMDCMGMRMAAFQAFFYGPGAAQAVASKERWQAWLNNLFPPSAGAAPAS